MRPGISSSAIEKESALVDAINQIDLGKTKELLSNIGPEINDFKVEDHYPGLFEIFEGYTIKCPLLLSVVLRAGVQELDRGMLDIVKEIVFHKDINIDIIDHMGDTLLYLIQGRYHDEIIAKYLLEAGVGININRISKATG